VRVWATWDAGDSSVEFESNPLVSVSEGQEKKVWADMHGQSGETIGTGSIEEYFRFARDLACVDVAGHQGNDFQITRDFWAKLQGVTATFNEEERFITFPGYEWSGNTAVGGDRNIYFRTEGNHIRRSSHALCPDVLDAGDDCTNVGDLFEELSAEDCLVVPHVGGRYADVHQHAPELERSVEVHSAWGTFEWILHDAIRDGHIVGIVAMSDGHKGRPGASHPGRGKFGSYGGLTCLSVDALTRDEVWNAFRNRHHYATTGARTVLFLDGTELKSGYSLRMGDYLQLAAADKLRLSARYVGTGPVLAVDVFNGLDLVEHRRIPGHGDRILVSWSGSLRRGRGRQINWSGSCEVEDGEISDIKAINFHNPESPLRQDSPSRLSWNSFTTGGWSGFVGRLSNPLSGKLQIRTDRLDYTIDLESIDKEEIAIPAGGVDAQLRVMRLPSKNESKEIDFEAEYELYDTNAIYLRITQEDGTITWSSPMYIDRKQNRS